MQPIASQDFLDWSRLGPLTTFLVHELHYGALAFMVLAFLFKTRHLLKLPAVV